MGVYQDKRSGKWYFRFKYKGKEYCRYEANAVTEQDCKNAEAAFRIGLLNQRYEITEGRAELLFKDLMVEFITCYPKFWATEGKMRLICDYFGEMRLREINSTTIQSFVNLLENSKNSRGKDYSGGTINRYLAVISKIFAFAIDREYISKNPALHRKVKRCPERGEIVQYLTDDEEQALFDAITPEYDYMKGILLVLLYSGIRWGELTKLEWKKHIDLQFNMINLTPDITKSKKARSIPMHPLVIELLTEMKKRRVVGVDLVFYNPKTYKKWNNVRKSWITLKKRAGIDPEFRVQSLRHSFATKLMSKNVNPATIKNLLGHCSLAVTDKYAHARRESLRTAINSL